MDESKQPDRAPRSLNEKNPLMTTHAPISATSIATPTGNLLIPARVRPSLSELRPARWHGPLLALAAAAGVLVIVNTAGVFLDPREVTNAAVWMKPLKFALSIGLYSLTLAWLIGRLPSGSRTARIASIAGTISAAGLVVELLIINGFALIGESSHFNVSTPFHEAMWHTMAGSIMVVWVMTLLVAALLFFAPLGDAARSVAIRGGAVLALAGMALAFLMTGHQGDQFSNIQDVAGAHTVGLADGGPGLPLLGWSTIGGDLRIPHFVGMHALQALPLFVLLLEVLAWKVPALRHAGRRFWLVLLALVTFASTVALLTFQALLGQSIVAPSGIILTGGIVLTVVAFVAAMVIMTTPRSIHASQRHSDHQHSDHQHSDHQHNGGIT
jgi:uncharacterized membrane protein (DUF485 family)